MALPSRSDGPPTATAGEGPDLLLSDAERLEVIERLQHAAGEGRLSLDEFSERVDLVLAARTAPALAPVLVGLPGPSTGPAAAAAPARRRARSGRRRRVVAVMGGSDRKGRWQLHRRTTALAVLGGVTLDLRGASIDGPEVELRCFAFLGGVDVIVPEGVPVDFGGFVLMGGRDEKIADVPEVAGAPVVRVRGYGMWGSVDVTSKPGPAADRPLVDEVRLRLRHTLDRVLPAPAPRPGPAGLPGAGPGTVAVLVVALAPAATGRPGLRRRVWRTAADARRAMVHELLTSHGASHAEETDAGVVARFGSARAALRAAAAVRRRQGGEPAFELRAGVHAAELDEVRRDAAAVIGAAALARAAGPGEVLVSDLAVRLVADLAAGDATVQPAASGAGAAAASAAAAAPGELRFGHGRAVVSSTASGGALRAHALLER